MINEVLEDDRPTDSTICCLLIPKFKFISLFCLENNKQQKIRPASSLQLSCNRGAIDNSVHSEKRDTLYV